MNREIKFRAWDIDWKDKDSNSPQGRMDYSPVYVNPPNLDINSVFIRGSTLLWMQYTGLKDKNGKEIYEGDIIKYCYDTKSCFTQEVVFGDWVQENSCDTPARHVGFYMKGKDGKEDWFSDFPKIDDIEIIGNIYENPELLN